MKQYLKKWNTLILSLILILFIAVFLFYSIKETEPFQNQLFQSKKIHISICQAKTENNTIEFMYDPILVSIKKYIQNSSDNADIHYTYRMENVDKIQPNDILIWVGNNEIPDFDLLKKKQIYTIWYNTEPDTHVLNADEIWTYSKYLFDQYKKQNHNQIIQFVPILCEENVPNVPYSSKKSDNMKLSFIGSLAYRPDKKEVLNSNPFIKTHLEEVYHLWNNKDFNDYISKHPNIYLNLTKSGTNALPSVRINKLLSHKCIVLSEHTNATDESLYEGMIYFCDLAEIGPLFETLSNKSNTELQQEADKKYKRFYDTFSYKKAIQLIEQK